MSAGHPGQDSSTAGGEVPVSPMRYDNDDLADVVRALSDDPAEWGDQREDTDDPVTESDDVHQWMTDQADRLARPAHATDGDPT